MRLQRGEGLSLPAARKEGQLFLRGKILHCPEADLRQRLENAPDRAVFLCRTLEALAPPVAVAWSYHCAGVEEGIPLGLDQGPLFERFLPMGARAVGCVGKQACHLMLVIPNFLGVPALLAQCCPTRGGPNVEGRTRDCQADSERGAGHRGLRG